MISLVLLVYFFIVIKFFFRRNTFSNNVVQSLYFWDFIWISVPFQGTILHNGVQTNTQNHPIILFESLQLGKSH